jgi:hypothetical protein
MSGSVPNVLDALDRRLINALQDGFPIAERPFSEVADLVNGYVEVAHNYRRGHRFNMWFVVACETPEEIATVLADIEARSALPVLDLPKEEEFFLELKLSA